MKKENKITASILDSAFNIGPANTDTKSAEEVFANPTESERRRNTTSYEDTEDNTLRKRKTITTTISPVIYNKIKTLAIDNGLNINEVIQFYLNEGIKSYEKKNGEIVIRNGKKSVRDMLK